MKIWRMWVRKVLVFWTVEARVEVRTRSGRMVFSRSDGEDEGGAARGVLRAKVSGRAKMMNISVAPPYMTRNHCVLRHPSPEPRAPPMMGANKGPHRGPR